MSDQTAPAAGGRHRPRAPLAAPPSGRESVDRLALRGDEAELFRRYGGWLMRVTRCRLGCSVALAEDACAHASLQALPHPADPNRQPALLAGRAYRFARAVQPLGWVKALPHASRVCSAPG